MKTEKNAPHESLSLLSWFLMTREFDETLKLEKQMMVINFTAIVIYNEA
ncbi:reverse transcriptase [Orientia tsutsugamushi]|uniref:Reverse transcriptase n=1 Tax=Orientia tsutsugamushi TaxID=784 RepID=A0A2U3R6E6_ORITS|nr:reverse transcriptase [Orientia tsutsugamushi]